MQFALQEIRSREEEMCKLAEEQKKHEDALKRREAAVKAREHELLAWELHYLLQQEGEYTSYCLLLGYI